MKKIITTLVSAFAVTTLFANEPISGEYNINKDEGYIKIDRFSSTNAEETVLTIEDKYTFSKTPYPTQILGNGTQALMRDNVSNYTSVIINATELATINAAAFSNLTNVTSFEIKTIEVPNAAETAFPAEWKTKCSLTVPEESLDKYMAAWGKYFKTINGKETEEQTQTAINDRTENRIAVKAYNGNIVLSKTAMVNVYSITGQQVFNGVTDKVAVANGVYIVKTEDKISKIVVK